MTEDPHGETAPEIASLESDIKTTRRSLNRKIGEISRRLQPDEVRAELKSALRRRLDVEPYLGWIAVSTVALGAWLAWRGWREAQG